VSAAWVAYPNRASLARYTVTGAGGGVLASRTINQRLAPNDFSANGALWEDVGTVTISAAGSLTVALAGQGNGALIADAVRFEYVDPLHPPPPVPPPPPPSQFTITLRMEGLTPSQEALFRAAADRWSEIITGDLPDTVFEGIAVDDVLIDASAIPIDGPGGVLGQAEPDEFRTGSWLPIYGYMQFDAADIGRQEANGSLWHTILHEIGHVLGVGTIWQPLGLLVGAGGDNPFFTGPRAMAEYGALIGVPSAPVPVENSGGPGTRDGHWRESVLGHESMTGYLSPGSNPISRVTVASMADLGYVVNLDAADPYP
jgi:hypothetical protein